MALALPRQNKDLRRDIRGGRERLVVRRSLEACHVGENSEDLKANSMLKKSGVIIFSTLPQSALGLGTRHDHEAKITD